MKFLSKSDELILKAFLEMKEPEYAKDLNLRYELEYFDCLAFKILQGSKNLNFKVEDFESDINIKIKEYIKECNLTDDKIHFDVSKLILLIAKKYYNEDGTLRDNNPFKK